MVQELNLLKEKASRQAESVHVCIYIFSILVFFVSLYEPTNVFVFFTFLTNSIKSDQKTAAQEDISRLNHIILEKSARISVLEKDIASK